MLRLGQRLRAARAAKLRRRPINYPPALSIDLHRPPGVSCCSAPALPRRGRRRRPELAQKLGLLPRGWLAERCSEPATRT